MGIANVQLKERKTLTLSDFRGVDFSSSLFSVAPNRAVDMENLMISNGRICKRPGWEVISRVNTNEAIKGIHYYDDGKKNGYLVASGKKLYNYYSKDAFLKGDVSDSYNITTTSGEYPAAFYPIKQDKIIIFYGGLFVCEYNFLSKANHKNNVYIPTTSVSYACSEGEGRLVTKEKINMLTRWRKNQLIKTIEIDEIEIDNTETEEEEESSPPPQRKHFVLDAFWSSKYQMSALFPEVYCEEDVLYEEQTLTSAKWEDLKNVNKPEDLDVYSNTYVLIGCDPYTKETTVFATITKDDVFLNTTSLRFSQDAMDYLGGRQIIVEYYADGEDQSEILNGCSRSILFGCNGNANCLLLTGNIEHKNTVYFSQIDNYLYFPDTNYFTVGSEDSCISGFLRLEDGTLVAFKDGEGGDSRIYYIKGSEFSEYDSDGALKWYTLKCTVSAGGIGERLIAPSSIATLAGDKLILSDNGVKGIVMSDNSFTTARYAKDRSYNINARLCNEENLSEAVGIVYKNRYYLAVNDVCYVADPDYRFYRDTDKDQSFNYEWWYWTNIPACCFAEIEGELWFGTKRGAICRFKKDSYTDDKRYELPDAWTKLTEDVEKDRLVYGGKSVIEGQEEEIVFYPSKNGEETVIKGDTVIRGETNLTGVPLFMVMGSYTEDGKTFPYIKLKLHENDENTIDIKEFTPGEFRAMLITRTPVVARWVSPYFDMGSNVYLKTLLRLTVSADSAVGEKLRFGYQTKQGSATHELQGHSYMDFEDMSFCDFSFDTKFADSYTKKLNVRNFNYIQFRFAADGKENVAINDLTATYKINKLSRGVR